VKNPYFDKISEVKTNMWKTKISGKAQLPEPEPMSEEEK
jgi:hypothetical protein